MPELLEVSTPQVEGVLQVSKSRKLPLLVSSGEMRSLFLYLGDVFLFDGSRPVEPEQARLEVDAFLSSYSEYVQVLQSGSLPDELPLRPYFSALLTCEKEVLYAMPLQNGKVLVKARRPVIQLKRHHFIFSGGEFHSGVMGEKSITWGVEFSYPQLSLDPKTQAIVKVAKSEFFPNTALFQKMAKWVRDYTRPTPFVVDGKQVNQSFRIGKECFGWINQHPRLKENGLYVGRI